MYCSEGRKEGVHHLLKKFLRLRSFNALISFSACALRGDVELFLASLFRSCGPTSTGDELLSVRSHVACVSKRSQKKRAFAGVPVLVVSQVKDQRKMMQARLCMHGLRHWRG